MGVMPPSTQARHLAVAVQQSLNRSLVLLLDCAFAIPLRPSRAKRRTAPDRGVTAIFSDAKATTLVEHRSAMVNKLSCACAAFDPNIG
jgi:hypothetical protein